MAKLKETHGQMLALSKAGVPGAQAMADDIGNRIKEMEALKTNMVDASKTISGLSFTKSLIEFDQELSRSGYTD